MLSRVSSIGPCPIDGGSRLYLSLPKAMMAPIVVEVYAIVRDMMHAHAYACLGEIDFIFMAHLHH